MQEILTVFGIDWRLLFVQAVNFGVLLAALYYVLYKPLLRMMDERQETIAKGVLNAQKAKEVKAAAHEEERRIIAEASEAARRIQEETKRQSEEERRRIIAEAEAHARRIKESSERERERIRADAARESREDIARLATLGAARILRKEVRENG